MERQEDAQSVRNNMQWKVLYANCITCDIGMVKQSCIGHTQNYLQEQTEIAVCAGLKNCRTLQAGSRMQLFCPFHSPFLYMSAVLSYEILSQARLQNSVFFAWMASTRSACHCDQ